MSKKAEWVARFLVSAGVALGAQTVPAIAVDNVWKTASNDTGTFTVRVVSSSGLGGSFPDRALSMAMDGALLRDIYVVDNATGQAVDRPLADAIVYMLQSSFKYPAYAGAGLSPNDALPSGDVTPIAADYPLYTSAYFSSSFVSSFIRGGAEGIDDFDDRRRIYRDLIFDLAFQPDLYKNAHQDPMATQLSDWLHTIDQWNSTLGSAAEAIEEGLESEVVAFADLAAVVDGTSFPDRIVDLRRASPPSRPALDDLGEALDAASAVVDLISAHAARVLMLQSLGNERTQLRLDVLRDFVARASAAGGLDPALEMGFADAETEIESYLDEYYSSLVLVLQSAADEWPDGVIHTANFLNQLVKVIYGKPLFSIPARVALPWQLNFMVFQGIRAQADYGRTASLAAALQRKLFDPTGLQYHRDRIHQSPTKNLVDAQAFMTLQQMAYYLAQRHYGDSLLVLNNRVSWIWGRGIDLFTGGSYTAQMDDLSASHERRRTIGLRISPPSYLATVPDVYAGGVQPAEGAWLGQYIRGEIPAMPTPPPVPLLGVCVTLPFDPGGQPASLEDVNIRFEPRGCSDIDSSQPWECGQNDPDGTCTARVQLFWDNDINQGNANCTTRTSGPCPIAGAEALNPKRGLFNWQPMLDSVKRGNYRILARITDAGQTAIDYSDGYFEFIDPIFEADAWSVQAVDVREESQSDHDGVPELGEEIGVTLRLKNTSGRALSAVKVHRLRLDGEAARQQLLDDFDPTVGEDRFQNFIFDDTVTVPSAGVGAVVTASDDFNVWAGTASPTAIGMRAWVEYADPGNPVTPQYRRLQEIAFTVQVSGGGSAADLRCSDVDLVDDTDHDGVFESGEKGYFQTTICNDGSWSAGDVRGIFDDPPLLGSWVDNDAGFGTIPPSGCVEAADDYTLRLENTQCGAVNLPMTIEWAGGNSTPDSHCSISATCVPRQSVQDEVQAGTVVQGQALSAAASITNTGAATLTITTVNVQGAPADTQVTSFPPTLAPGQAGSINVSIDTTSIPFGAQSRTLLTVTNANNLNEHEIVILFTVSSGAVAEQVTTSGVPQTALDVSGDWAVFARGLDIWAVNIRTKEERRITNTPEQEVAPRIDGTRIVFQRMNAAGDIATADVYLYDLASSQETQLSNAAGSQRGPDIYGDTVLWISGGTACNDADAYRYVIGQSPINGVLYHDPGANRAVQQARIDRLFAVFRTISWTDPVGCSTKVDLAFKDRSTGTAYTVGLEPGTVCNNVQDPSIYENGLAFSCRCSGPCGGDSDYKIRYYDMALRSGSVQLTCDSTFSSKKENPTIAGPDVIYNIGNSGARDLYRVAIGSGCATEVPLHTGPQDSALAAADPRAGGYVFNDNQTGANEIWAVVPPPPYDGAVTSFYFDEAEIYQSGSYGYHVEVRNLGTMPLTNLGVTVQEGVTVIDTFNVPSLAVGAAALLAETWSTVAVSAGLHSLEATLLPIPSGDTTASNNSQQLVLEVLDEDVSPPVVSGQHAVPTPPEDGDPYLEAGEGIRARWVTTDASGIQATHALVGGTQYPGAAEGGGVFGSNLPNPGPGTFVVELFATDADDSAETTPTGTPLQVTVFPAAPAIVGRSPAPGSMGVPATTLVDVDFDTDLDPSSISGATVWLSGPGGNVPSGIAYNGGQWRIRLTPQAALADGLYEVHVEGGPSGVRDVRLNPLATTNTWTFTVSSDPTIFADGFESGDTNAWSNAVP